MMGHWGNRLAQRRLTGLLEMGLHEEEQVGPNLEQPEAGLVGHGMTVQPCAAASDINCSGFGLSRPLHPPQASLLRTCSSPQFSTLAVPC